MLGKKETELGVVLQASSIPFRSPGLIKQSVIQQVTVTPGPGTHQAFPNTITIIKAATEKSEVVLILM